MQKKVIVEKDSIMATVKAVFGQKRLPVGCKIYHTVLQGAFSSPMLVPMQMTATTCTITCHIRAYCGHF